MAADGSGRADGSRHQRSFWRLWPTAKERWSDRAARVPQASAKKAELTSHKTNASHMNAETSQHWRRVDHDHNGPETIRKPTPSSVRWCPAFRQPRRWRESVVLPEFVSARRHGQKWCQEDCRVGSTVSAETSTTALVRTPYALGYIAKERLPQAPGDDHGATLPCRGLEGIQSRSSVGGYR